MTVCGQVSSVELRLKSGLAQPVSTGAFGGHSHARASASTDLNSGETVILQRVVERIRGKDFFTV